MTIHSSPTASLILPIPKSRTGIDGLDAVLDGGLPTGRPTLICGSAGCGKTLFAMTFLVRGALDFGEPGVLMSFEESEGDLAANVGSLGFDVPALIDRGLLLIDQVRIERADLEEAGDYDLEGLFIRLGYAIDKIGAKRVVLDTLEALFSSIPNEATLRAELRRLFAWLKEKGVTAIITGERGEGALTRNGLEEYVSDCVILLDNRVTEQSSTRRLRVVKYRGSAHGTNEFPFLIDSRGISVLPITAAGLSHESSDEVVSSGIAGIDAMLGAGGFYKGSSVLVSGSSGTGKTIFGGYFAHSICAAGQRCLMFAFEESPNQIIRNLRSVGLELQPHVDAGLLRISAARPSLYGLEMHLTLMHRDIDMFQPDAVVLDPISAFFGPRNEVHAMLLRMVDVLKSRGITALFTNLTSSESAVDKTDVGLSSLMDTWIGLHHLEANGERNRGLYLLKSRGMAHSNQVREYALSHAGVSLVKPYIGAGGVLTGSARLTQESQERAKLLEAQQEVERRRRTFAMKRKAVERQIADLQLALATESDELELLTAQDTGRTTVLEDDRVAQAALRNGGNARS